MKNDQLPLSRDVLEEIDRQPKLEFNATSYAVIEREQRVQIIVKRTGPTDVRARFRCLYSFVLTSIYALCYDTMQHCI